MRLIANTVTPNDVVEEWRDGDRFLIIEDVPFVRAQELAGGYVPDSEIRASTRGWDGTLLTANHPRNGDGMPVPAETRADEYRVGYAESPTYDGEYARVDMAVNADRATDLGGEAAAIVEKIEAGESFDVSSQYFPKELPPGEYDGAHRANVEGIREPDSIALLPNKPGKCSLREGCGINPAMAANAEVRIPAADDPDGEDAGLRQNKRVDGLEFDGTASGELDEAALPTDGFESHYVFDGRTKSESSFPVVDANGTLRRGNVAAAWDLRGHARDESRLVEVLSDLNGEFDDPPIDPDDIDAEQSANAADTSDGPLERALSFIGWNRDTDEPAEPGADAADDTMHDSEKIEYLVANSEYDRESLEAWEGTDCLTTLYDSVKANNEGDGGGDEPTDNDPDDTMTDTDTEDDSEEEAVLTEDELEAMIEQKAEEKAAEIAANREEQSEKRELATDIVANSAEYDDAEAVTDDFPTVAALETKKEQVTGGGAVPGAGVTPNAAQTDGEDPDDIPSGVY